MLTLRVDVQGGRKVATLEYGGRESCDGEDWTYPDRHHTGLRELLRRTGTPRADNTQQPIGPRPDLWRAIAALPSAVPVLADCASGECRYAGATTRWE